MAETAYKEYTSDDIPKPTKNPERGEMAGPDRESQADLYVDYRDINHYQFLHECQNGKGGFSGNTRSATQASGYQYNKKIYSYIIPNKTENFYKTRVKRAVFINYFKKYIKAKYKDVFALQEVNTSVSINSEIQEDHPYLSFTQNVTGGGMDKNDFIKNILNASWRDAVSFIVIDKKINESMPYTYLKNAIDVACDVNGDYLTGTDDKGHMIWIIFNEKSKKVGEKTYLVRRYWGIDSFKVLQSADNGDTWETVEEIPNTLTYRGQPFLPVKPIISQERANNHDYMPFPDAYSIAEIVLAIYDRGSVLDYLIDKQGHSILVINGTTNGVGNGRDNALIIDTMENKAFQPFYMSPDSNLPGVHAARIAKLTEEMLDMMDDGGVTASAKSVTQESGVSKAFSFSAKATTSKESLRLAGESDEFIEKGYKVFMNEDTASWTSSTSYPTEYIPQTETTFKDMEDAADFFDQRNLKKNESNVIKKYIYKLYPNASQEELSDLLEEVEVLEPTE